MIRSVHVLLVVVVAIISGCNRRPDGVMSKELMTDVLFDIHRTEAVVEMTAKYRPLNEKQEIYGSVFEKWGITKETFDRSLEWYAEHTDEINLIYDTLRMRADVLQSRVEAYEFHPDARPSKIDSIEDFDMWKWQCKQFLMNSGSSYINKDSLQFMIADSSYFARGNDLVFDLAMTAKSIDNVTYRTMLVFHYSDSVVDTLCHRSIADSITRRFHYFKHLPDTVALCRLQIILVDEPFYLSSVEIDKVSLKRRYNRYTSPVLFRVRQEVRNSRDSIVLSKKK